MTAGRHSRNYVGSLYLTWESIRLNTLVDRFPSSWKARLRERLGPKSTAAALGRWAEAVSKLTDSERGGIRPDASDSDICQQADVTARDFRRRLRMLERLLRVGPSFSWLRDRFGLRAVPLMLAGFCKNLLDRRGMLDVWRWRKPSERGGALARMACPRFWRKVYRKLHARTIGAVEIDIGMVRRTAGLYCSDDQVKRSAARSAGNVAALQSVVAVNDMGQAYTLAELAAKGVANQEIRRHELLTRIAGFELIAKDCGHIAYMVTVTCPSRFHKATTRGDRVVDNPRYAHLTPRDGQEYLSEQWKLCRTRGRALKRGEISKQWYGFRIAEPQHDGTPHWHLLLFFPPALECKLQDLFLLCFLENDSPEERGAVDYRVDFEKIDWARGSAVGYVIKYVSKNIDGNGVGVDLEGKPAIESSRRVKAWSQQWGIRQFQQIGGAPVGVWRELRRVHPENVPDHAPAALRGAIEAMNPQPEQGEQLELLDGTLQANAWAKYNGAQGGVGTCRKALRIKLIKEKNAAKTRYGEASPDRTVGVWSAGVELFVPAHMAHLKHAAPMERLQVLEVESERAQWLMGGVHKGAAQAIAAGVFKRSREAASTRIHVNNCTGPRDWNAPPPSMFAPVRRRQQKLRRFGWHETAPGGSPAIQKE
ncbi:replication endonuclease [Acidovorax sp. LjRoot194]|uniref:replication endonuclease n=1 Tax=Acidovorax sp. LjRoot194 TaxID=3342280 RepID=UPI003ED06C78